MDDFYMSVDRHQHDVDRHHTGNMPLTIPDYNRLHLFYSDRSAIRPPTFARANFEFKPWYNDLVSRNRFDSFAGKLSLDHIKSFEDLVSSIKAEGVPADYLLCKLFPYTLGERGISWLKQLKPGSLTSWKETKDAYVNHFYDESMSKELWLKIFMFWQGPTESFKAAWVRFWAYQRDCPHHGVSEVRLLGIFFRGVNWRYQSILDDARNGNFNNRIPSEATELIENLTSSVSNRSIDNERKRLAETIEIKSVTAIIFFLLGKPVIRFSDPTTNLISEASQQTTLRLTMAPPTHFYG